MPGRGRAGPRSSRPPCATRRRAWRGCARRAPRRALADEQRVRDAPVRVALGDEREHLPLAGRQAERIGGGPAGSAACGVAATGASPSDDVASGLTSIRRRRARPSIRSTSSAAPMRRAMPDASRNAAAAAAWSPAAECASASRHSTYASRNGAGRAGQGRPQGCPMLGQVVTPTRAPAPRCTAPSASRSRGWRARPVRSGVRSMPGSARSRRARRRRQRLRAPRHVRIARRPRCRRRPGWPGSPAGRG